ncbi:polysaccharide biosynthesis tyrosine autokinase [Tumebacillus sp. ITR2]|uniref:Polysaccharide biosynthesis tyrosine autokinase n=1 Tax=Tumebacillus amylolyticus TaxID=2801339 RepID=A0ABS1J7D4_9BACL|nr:polysaccharide biosynthesis tyrosine autokinase [Tumebacillus amylolyticus]MBL0386115.1 polysaccharide biosynthesis tyrosine autokinase [Tumebacillus amylolyticus]
MKFLLLKYWKAVRKRIWLIGLLVVFAVATSYVFTTHFVTPQYRATTKLIVNLKPTENTDAFLSDVMAYPKMMKTYNEILKSYTVTSAVVSKLGLKMTPEALGASITITSVNESQIIAVQVTDSDEKRVALLADEVSYMFIDKVEQIMQSDNIFVLDKAQGRGVVKLKPNLNMNLLTAAVLAVLAGVGGLVLREYLDTRLKMREEVKSALGLVMVGEIGVWKTESRRFAWLRKLKFKSARNDPNRRVMENYNALYRNLVPLSILQEIKTLSMVSTVRHEGKSTVLTQFAVHLAQSGQRVLLIDGDIEHPALHVMLQVPNTVGLGDFLGGRMEWRDAVQGTRVPHLQLLSVGTMTQAGVKGLGGEAFERMLREARETYDLVLIDTTALGESLVPQVVAPQTDGVLFLVGSGTVHRDDAKLALDALTAVGANVLGTVLNNYDGKTEKSPFFLERVGNQVTLNK